MHPGRRGHYLHAIVREILRDNMPSVDEAWWTSYRDRLEKVAREVGG